uniref:Antigen T5 n=1 Tax=Mycobacterium leprae TaxID=1769 RepID=P95672_MYCLR|nr:antigen T5 [Mycobacterium leprae]CAA19095.1 antigen T5 [Mycobacterium leprae]
MRRRTKRKSLQKEPEFLLRLSLFQSHNRKHPFLDITAVNTNRAATNLVAVTNDVVGIGQHAAGIGLYAVLEFRFRRCEGMMHRSPRTRAHCHFADLGGLVGAFEKRRVDYPDERPGLGVDQTQPVGDLTAGGPQQCPRRLRRAR